MISIERITTQDPLYESERMLRNQALFIPLGLAIEKFEADSPGIENDYEHFAAIMNHPTGDRVIGCCGLLADDPVAGEGRLLQLAVDPQLQGAGIGRRLVVAIESRAFSELGLTRLSCHAREEIAAFYTALGWTSEGDTVEEMGIAHRQMVLERAPERVERPL